MEFADLPRRFSVQGRHTFDHWQDEKLSQVTVANTPENLLKEELRGRVSTYSFICMQNALTLQHKNCHFKTWYSFLSFRC